MDTSQTCPPNEYHPDRICELARQFERFDSYEDWHEWICLHVRYEEFWSGEDDEEDDVV